MSTMLLIDAGNTRVKWALAKDGEIERGGSSVHAGQSLEAALAPIARVAVRPARALVSCVGGDGLVDGLRRVVEQAFAVTPEFVAVRREAFGLRIAYEHPERLGVDRWLAMLGARSRHRGPLLVVGAGTALTVDAVAEDGTHLGGLIVPGLATMKQSLLERTAGIRDAGDAARTPEIFAADTGDAVHGGVAHALAAVVDRAADELHRRVGTAARVLLTGGDAEFLWPLIATPVEIEPDLVLHGLVVYARAR